MVGDFPLTSQTFIINQVADLLARGVEVEVFARGRSRAQHVSARFHQEGLAARTHYLVPESGRVARFGATLAAAGRLLVRAPGAFGRWLATALHAPRAAAPLLTASAAFAGRPFDVVHCHFGDVAVAFLEIRRVLGQRTPLVTSFYGVDVSAAFQHEPPGYYDGLKAACSLYYVMSENMRGRVIAHGFDAEKVKVHPVSIDVASFPFAARQFPATGPIRLLAVGRCVEKKGFDDLLRALALAGPRAPRPLDCTIVGDGPLFEELQAIARQLGLAGAVHFNGPMKIEAIIELMREMHLLVAPSKTARDGDME